MDDPVVSDVLACIQELRRSLPEPPQVARIEVGQAMLDWLKETARPEGAPPDNPWRPVGWTPPPPIGALFGMPVVLREDLDPSMWRAIDRHGNVTEEGRCELAPG